MTSTPSGARYPSAPMIILLADLTGYTRGFLSHTDEEMAAFLDRFFHMAEEEIGRSGGRIVKFLGDAVLGMFPPDDAVAAVAAAVAMRERAAELTSDVGLDCRLGSNIHFGKAIATELGAGASRRFDIIGRAVNQTFLLGSGGGIRLSERVYRKLPSSERTPWQRRNPPAVYVLDDPGKPFRIFGKSPEQNAERW